MVNTSQLINQTEEVESWVLQAICLYDIQEINRRFRGIADKQKLAKTCLKIQFARNLVGLKWRTEIWKKV